MRKYLWQLISLVLLIGLVITSAGWAEARRLEQLARNALELSFDSAYTTAYSELNQLSRVLQGAIERGSLKQGRPDDDIRYHAMKFSAAIAQMQFGEYQANAGTSLFFGDNGEQAGMFTGYLLLIEDRLTRQGGQLTADVQDSFAAVVEELDNLTAAWAAGKTPDILREGMSKDEIYLEAAEAREIFDSLRRLNNILDRLQQSLGD